MDVRPTRDHDCRYRVLENQLLLIAGLQDYGILVKRSDAAGQFYSADQVDGDVVPFLSCRIEERILNVLLCRLRFHLPISFVRCCALSLGIRGLAAALVSIGSYN